MRVRPGKGALAAGAAAAPPPEHASSQQRRGALFTPPHSPLLPPSPPGFTTLHVLPHVDPVQRSSGGNMWRNVVRFDPLARLQGGGGNNYSYEDVSRAQGRGRAGLGAAGAPLCVAREGRERAAG
jgi:hypothetical protein